MDLLPDKLHQLRWKLNQKARKELKFRFYAPYDRVCRRVVLEAAWKHVGKKGKAAGIDGVRAEDILGKEGGVDEFAATDITDGNILVTQTATVTFETPHVTAPFAAWITGRESCSRPYC